MFLMMPVRFFEKTLVLFHLSTPLGLLTDRMARLNKVGGEVLFFIW